MILKNPGTGDVGVASPVVSVNIADEFVLEVALTTIPSSGVSADESMTPFMLASQ
jgi:hypothetical protein